MTAFLSSIHQTSSNSSPLPPLTTPDNWLTQSQLQQLGRTSLEPHIGSILVLTDDHRILYATENLRRKLNELTETEENGQLVAQELIFICQVLKQCRDCFPNQNWAIEFDIFTKDAIALHIRSRWLKLDDVDRPCILLVVEDRQQLVQDMMLDEAQDWGLTEREQEVWLLHQDGYTYKRIADKLYITINTVKKHMRSIHAKRKACVDTESDE